MVERLDGPSHDAEQLLAVIGIQTEIAQLGRDLDGVMTLVARRAQALTGATGAAVELAEGDAMVYRAATGIAAPQLGLRIARDGSLSGLCVREGIPLACDDSERDPRVDRESCRKVGLRSMIVVPLGHHGEVVGVLKVLSPVPNAFTDSQIALLGLMADLIAAAMYHAA